MQNGLVYNNVVIVNNQVLFLLRRQQSSETNKLLTLKLENMVCKLFVNLYPIYKSSVVTK